MNTPLPRKKLPIGIQTFAKLREQGCYYVDKTRMALDLIDQGGYYFLSRPRRFGKSLLLDTLAELFEGNRSLFAAFYASMPHQWFTNSPVAQNEGYYASVFYSYFAALGLDITCEESSNAGRLHMAIQFNSQIYLFEFKVVEIAPEGRALKQIITAG